MGNGALPPLPGWILRMKKGVLFALLVGGMDHDLRRADDVHVHFHAHLEKEQLGVGLQTVDFQDVRVAASITDGSCTLTPAVISAVLIPS